MAVLTVAGQDLIKSAKPCTSPCEDAPWIWEDATSLGSPPIMATTAWAAVGVADGLEELSMNPTRTAPIEGEGVPPETVEEQLLYGEGDVVHIAPGPGAGNEPHQEWSGFGLASRLRDQGRCCYRLVEGAVLEGLEGL